MSQPTVRYVEIDVLPDGRMDTTNAARYLGLTVKTLAQWRWAGTGPAFCKPGRVWYYQADLDAWIHGRARRVQVPKPGVRIWQGMKIPAPV